jgi:hypothetical protein
MQQPAYKRHWGAYGNKPHDKSDGYDPKRLRNSCHPSLREGRNDGFSIRDRISNRIQVFKDGTFVKEWFYERNTLGNGAIGRRDLARPEAEYLLRRRQNNRSG